MTYGKNFKYYREKNGLSQEDLANKLNISRQAKSRWENDWNIPDMANLQELCKLYNITMDELLSENISQCESDDSEQISKSPVTKAAPEKEKYLSHTLLIYSLLILCCFLGIFGIFIAGFILYYCIKQKEYSKITILFCIFILIVCIFNTWGYLNTFFFDVGYESYEKI